MTTRAQDITERSSKTSVALVEMHVVNMLGGGLSFDDAKEAEEFFTRMYSKYCSTMSTPKLSGKVLVEERIAEMDPETHRAGIDAQRVTERLKTQFNIDAGECNEKLFKDLDSLSDTDCRTALLYAVKAAHLQQKRHRADEEMLEHMMEVAFMRDSDAYSNEREVERLKKAVADLEKKTSLAEKGINAFNAQVTELEKKASEQRERIVNVVLDIQSLRYKSSGTAQVKPARIQRDPAGYLERAVESLKRSVDGDGDATNCSCLPMQLFVQAEKDALQAQHNKLLDVYECALENRKRDKEEMERLSRKVTKMHALQDEMKANDRQLQAITAQHAADVEHWRKRETELKTENERLTRQCEKARRSLEKQQVASSSKKAAVAELRQVVQELADENEILLEASQVSNQVATNSESAQVMAAVPECPICFDSPNASLYRCGHRYCYDCATAERVRSGTCPLCREPIVEIIRNY